MFFKSANLRILPSYPGGYRLALGEFVHSEALCPDVEHRKHHQGFVHW